MNTTFLQTPFFVAMFQQYDAKTMVINVFQKRVSAFYNST